MSKSSPRSRLINEVSRIRFSTIKCMERGCKVVKLQEKFFTSNLSLIGGEFPVCVCVCVCVCVVCVCVCVGGVGGWGCVCVCVGVCVWVCVSVEGVGVVGVFSFLVRIGCGWGGGMVVFRFESELNKIKRAMWNI